VPATSWLWRPNFAPDIQTCRLRLSALPESPVDSCKSDILGVVRRTQSGNSELASTILVPSVCPFPDRRCSYGPESSQLISRGRRTWLVRVSLGSDPETGTRKCHNKTIRRSLRESLTYLSVKLQLSKSAAETMTAQSTTDHSQVFHLAAPMAIARTPEARCRGGAPLKHDS
jgi:hypothetical protein